MEGSIHSTLACQQAVQRTRAGWCWWCQLLGGWRAAAGVGDIMSDQPGQVNPCHVRGACSRSCSGRLPDAPCAVLASVPLGKGGRADEAMPQSALCLSAVRARHRARCVTTCVEHLGEGGGPRRRMLQVGESHGTGRANQHTIRRVITIPPGCVGVCPVGGNSWAQRRGGAGATGVATRLLHAGRGRWV